MLVQGIHYDLLMWAISVTILTVQLGREDRSWNRFVFFFGNGLLRTMERGKNGSLSLIAGISMKWEGVSPCGGVELLFMLPAGECFFPLF